MFRLYQVEIAPDALSFSIRLMVWPSFHTDSDINAQAVPGQRV